MRRSPSVRQNPKQQSAGSAEEVRALARRFGIRPTRGRGQNFLLDPVVTAAMVRESGIGPGDRVVEVGGGFGILTEALLASGADVITVELEEKLAAALISRFRGNERFHIVTGDFLRWYRLQASVLGKQPFSIVANIPYSISSFFFRTVLVGSVVPQRIVVLLQKEVAERIAAPVGDMSLIALLVQYCGTPTVLRTVPRRSFWPQPDVDSAILKLQDIHKPDMQFAAVMRIARIAFSGKRKQIHNTLANGLHRTTESVEKTLRDAGIAPNARPQELSIAQWKMLASAVEQPGEN